MHIIYYRLDLMSNKKQPKLKTPYAHLRDAAAANREKSLNSIRLVFALLGIITAIIFYRKPDIINTLTSSNIFTLSIFQSSHILS